MRNTPSSTRWCRMPPTARCCAAGASRYMPVSPQRLKTNSRRLWLPNLRCLPGTARKPGWRRRRSLIGSKPVAGDGALGDDRSGRPAAERAGRARPACRTALGAGNKSWTCNSRLDRHWLSRKVFRHPRWARPSRERARWPSRLIDPSTSCGCSLANGRFISEPGRTQAGAVAGRADRKNRRGAERC